MMRKWLFAMAMLLPGATLALGLGKLDLNSALNEPFDARIPLLSASVEELDSLKAGLASPEAFERAGLQYGFGLEQLKFEIRQPESGSDYIRVYSTEAIREPFLNFLLELNWSQGRLYREFTVLLDPPMYDPARRQMEMAAAPASPAGTFGPGQAIEDNQVTYDLDYQSTAPSRAPSVDYSGGEYGPVGDGDTLWSIASAMRPDNSVSVQQMMLALLKANPEAFINNNINGLKRGQILSMPGEAQMRAVDRSAAIELAKSQNDLWNDIRVGMAEAATERPESAGVTAREEPVTTDTMEAPAAGEDAELRLVAPDDSGEGIDEAMTEAGEDAETQRLMSLANETIAALESENIELNDRLTESESIIEDLKRLIQLKEDELAALQSQIAAADAAMEEEPMTAEEEMAGDAGAMEEEAPADGMEEPVADATAKEEEAMAAEPMAEDSAPSTGSGIMVMVNQYLGPVIESVKSNIMAVGGAIAAIILALVGFMFVQKRKSGDAETVDIPEADFPDFEDVTEAATDTGAESMLDVGESEAATETPEAEEQEDKTPTPEIPHVDDATQIAAPEETPVAAAPEEEDDPLAEVNVFLAYEHFDQAEEFVKDAIENDPDNLEFHSKLLEVYYAAGNKKSYEEEARVLHEKVDGQGPHWDMAIAMWSELSPNRALFEEGGDDEDEAPVETAGGIMDLTAGEEAPAEEDKDAGLDFDIGADDDEDAVLDVTSGADTSGDDEILDVTAASGESDSDLLDVTAAVGLDETATISPGTPEPEEETAGSDDDDLLDITGGGNDDEVLDITTGGEQAEEEGSTDDDVLDISQSSGDDLLDVTASSNLTPDSDDDLLDVTSASTTGADSGSLLDVDTGDTETADDSTLDFDMEGLDLDISEDDNAATSESDPDSMIEKSMESGETGDEDNVIDFEGLSADDSGSDEDVEGTVEVDAALLGIETEDDDSSEEETTGVDLDLTVDAGETPETDADDSSTDDDLSLDIEIPDSGEEDSAALSDGESSEDLNEFSLDLDTESDDSRDEKGSGTEFSLDLDGDSGGEDFDLDLEIQDEPESEPEKPADEDAVPEIDMESTVELPKNKLELVNNDDDDDDDKTVFVPKSSATSEQSREDEVSTKLDLAKAYVELGDGDSAKTILEEIMNEGTEEQQQQAQDLLKQV